MFKTVRGLVTKAEIPPYHVAKIGAFDSLWDAIQAVINDTAIAELDSTHDLSVSQLRSLRSGDDATFIDDGSGTIERTEDTRSAYDRLRQSATSRHTHATPPVGNDSDGAIDASVLNILTDDTPLMRYPTRSGIRGRTASREAVVDDALYRTLADVDAYPVESVLSDTMSQLEGMGTDLYTILNHMPPIQRSTLQRAGYVNDWRRHVHRTLPNLAVEFSEPKWLRYSNIISTLRGYCSRGRSLQQDDALRVVLITYAMYATVKAADYAHLQKASRLLRDLGSITTMDDISTKFMSHCLLWCSGEVFGHIAKRLAGSNRTIPEMCSRTSNRLSVALGENPNVLSGLGVLRSLNILLGNSFAHGLRSTETVNNYLSPMGLSHPYIPAFLRYVSDLPYMNRLTSDEKLALLLGMAKVLDGFNSVEPIDSDDRLARELSTTVMLMSVQVTHSLRYEVIRHTLSSATRVLLDIQAAAQGAPNGWEGFLRAAPRLNDMHEATLQRVMHAYLDLNGSRASIYRILDNYVTEVIHARPITERD